jgi:hypothetical protein
LPFSGAVHAGLVAKFFDDALADGQSQAVTFGAGLVEARKGRKNLGLLVWRKAGAVITNEETVAGLILGVTFAKFHAMSLIL